MCDSDGSNCSQLIDLHGTSATARWSPDGHYLAFESVTQDYWQVGVLELPDGTPHMLTTFPDTNNGAPNWSRDGKWIYFYSGHDGGAYQLWKMPFARWISRPSDDKRGCLCDRVEGRTVPLLRQIYQCGIWKKSLDTGEESRLPINVCNWYEWDRCSRRNLLPEPGFSAEWQNRILRFCS